MRKKKILSQAFGPLMVRYNSFSSRIGFKQGYWLSPLLFSLFKTNFIQGDVNIRFYEDDVVLLADQPSVFSAAND